MSSAPPPPQPAAPAPPAANAAPPRRHNARRVAIASTLAVAALAAAASLAGWISYRFTHSLSRDAFLDSDLINVSSYVTGDITEVYVQEQSRVTRGQVLARIDPS